jgi:succinate dehydrogenase / fumarate reductase cytochrome b subunit
MSTKPAQNRPMSPFMIGPYYRPQLTSMLSITHRLTGLALTVGTVLLAGWLMAAATGPWAYSQYVGVMKSIPGQFLVFCWSWSLCFHLCNGVRHLFWDTGRGFEMKTVYTSGYIVMGMSLALTAAAWITAYAC